MRKILHEELLLGLQSSDGDEELCETGSDMNELSSDSESEKEDSDEDCFKDDYKSKVV